MTTLRQQAARIVAVRRLRTEALLIVANRVDNAEQPRDELGRFVSSSLKTEGNLHTVTTHINDKLLGQISFQVHKGTAHVRGNVAITDEFQGKKLSYLMYKEAFKYAAALGATTWESDKNQAPQTRSNYKKLGAEFIPHVPDIVFKMADEKIPAEKDRVGYYKIDLTKNIDTTEVEATLKPVPQDGGREDLHTLVDERNLSSQPSVVNVASPSVNVTNQVDAPQVNVSNIVGVPNVTVQAPIVNVDLTPKFTADVTPTIYVDTAPLAVALKGIEDMLSQALQMMAAQPPIEVKVYSPIHENYDKTVPVNVTVEQPARSKRVLKIKHDDGTESTVTEQ